MYIIKLNTETYFVYVVAVTADCAVVIAAVSDAKLVEHYQNINNRCSFVIKIVQCTISYNMIAIRKS